MTFYVYEHWRTDKNVCFYVGMGHGNRAYVMYKRNQYHQNIQKKLKIDGCEVIVKIVMSGLTRERAAEEEKRRIFLWKVLGANICNIATGGDGGATRIGMKHTEETRKKMSEKRMGWSPSDETKAKMSAAKKNLSPEARRKIGLASKGRVTSDETKKKISEKLTGRTVTDEFRKKMSMIRKKTIENKSKAAGWTAYSPAQVATPTRG